MILCDLGDEIRGARILCIYQKRGKEHPVILRGGQHAKRLTVRGKPARAIIERPLTYRRQAPSV